MTISLEMVLPGIVGYWLDLQLGTRVVFMLVGFAIGMYVALRHLLQIAKADAVKTDAVKENEKRRTARKDNQK